MIFDSRDRLYIYDGPNANSSTISGSGSFLSGQVAGLNNYPNVVLTSRNQYVFLRFITDERNTHPGFRIHYEQGKYFNLPYKFRMMHFRLDTDNGNLFIVINRLIVKLEVNDDSAVDPCGSDKPLIIKDSISGNITSPRYPNPYLSNLDCEWEIHAQDEEAVVITLRDLYTEKK